MPTLVKKLRNGGTVQFDTGRFDDWCVYLKRPQQERFAPTDTHYFSRLDTLGNKYGHQKIYAHFIAVFEPTDTTINPTILTQIELIANHYGTDAMEVEEWFTVIYAGMIAEENKQKAILKKRIKRLGMYQTLIERVGAAEAASFSKGKKWRELDEIMKVKGF